MATVHIQYILNLVPFIEQSEGLPLAQKYYVPQTV